MDDDDAVMDRFEDSLSDATSHIEIADASEEDVEYDY